MNIKKFIIFSTTLTLLIYLMWYSFEDVQNKLEENSEKLKTQINSPEDYINNYTFDIPDKSGSIVNVPWKNHIEFQKTQENLGTDVLLAAFCTVIKITSEEEQHNVHLAAKSVSGTVIQPGEVFSQNKTIGPYTEDKGYKEGIAYIGGVLTPSIGGGACKVASTLYNLSVLSNLEIVERYNHSMPVHYLPYGQDATVAYGFKDLKFKNTTEFPILIWAIPIENRVYMGFYGNKSTPQVKWSHTILERRAAPIQYQVNPNLKEGEEKIVVEGMDGARVESFVTVEYSDGTIDKKNLGISNYWPMPHVIEVKNKPIP